MPAQLVAGLVSQVLVAPTSASLKSAPATGGAGGYTYQWYRSDDPDNVIDPANLLANQTSLTLVDTPLIENTIYYYQVVVTDAASISVPSNILGLCTSSKGQGTVFLNPSVAQFKSKFFRDFPYGTDPQNAILDRDILAGMQEVNTQMNTNLFINQSTFTNGYLFFAAHSMCENLLNSSQGINGQYNWLQQSKGVGPLSESFAIPEQIIKHPTYSGYAKTTYGRKYLHLIWPNLAGPMDSVFGNTKP